jgi:hypothetical protein
MFSSVDTSLVGAARPLLPMIDLLEAEGFSTRLIAGELRMTSVGAENCYAFDAHGNEFYAKDVPQGLHACA